MASLLQSLRATIRSFLRSPVFLAVTVFTLATGIGATSAIFTVVNAVLLRPLPYAEPEKLVVVWHTAPGLKMDQFEQSDASYLLYRKANRVLTDLGIFMEGSANLTGDGEPERLRSAGATGSLFNVLGVPPQLGRRLLEADEKPGAEPVAVLSHSLWKRRFGGEARAVGSLLQVDGVSRRVVGVMPEGFRFPDEETALWVPLTLDPAEASPGNFNFKAIGRLRPGVTPDQVARELSALVYRIPDEYGGKEISRGMLEEAKLAVIIESLRDDVVGDVERVLWVLLGSVGLILLIACANVANLFLVRAEGRQREMAVRISLGASRGTVFWAFLVESLGLALLGGALGLVLAAAGTRLLVRLRPEEIPRLDEIGMDGRVVAFTFALALLAGLVFGLLAALRYGSPNLAPALKEGGRGGTAGREGRRGRHVLVVSQVALALMLLVGAGLMVKSFWHLRNVDPGVDPRGVLTLRLNLNEASYPDSASSVRFVQRLVEKAQALPGVERAAVISVLPLSGNGSNSGHTFEDFPLPPDSVPPILPTRYVSPGYFQAMGIPVIEGKVFERIDPARPEDTAVVSQALAERFWPGKSAVGRRIFRGLPRGDMKNRWCTIIGVVGSVRDQGLDEKPAEAIYYPLLVKRPSDEDPNAVDQAPRSFSVVVKGSADPPALAPAVRKAIREIDPNLPLAEMRSFDEVLARSTARTSFTMLLLVIAAAVALLLGAVGIYGVVSYTVSQRTREIGVRMAMGANRWVIARMVLREGLVLTVLGIGIGLLGAFLATRLMVALLYEVTPTDPPVFASVPVLLALIALFSTYLPARRAADTEPLEAIRYE